MLKRTFKVVYPPLAAACGVFTPLKFPFHNRYRIVISFGLKQEILKKYVKIAVIYFLLLAGCNVKEEVLISGRTMGTTYHITVVTWYFKNLSDLKEKIDKRLKEINRSMSTFIKDSEISRFNALNRREEEFHISDDFLQVMLVAKSVYELTGGAWDGTIKPVENLWGFGCSERKKGVPKQEEIKKLLSDVGFDLIEISENRYLVKKKASLSLDLASIAKGYAVDQIAELIRTEGIENYLVEIGGEVYASGLRKDAKYWKVGINRPQKGAPYDQVYKVLILHDRALATSGDYRNFFEIDGHRYSHVLNPKTGYPVTNGVVSVSIIADSCVLADGLATGVMVLGPKKGLELINRLDPVECLIIVQGKDGSLVDYYSKGWKHYQVSE